MIDWILQSGINNAVIALGIALVARGVQATGKRPGLAHLLWLLVLVKLVTPPIVSVPLVPVPGLQATASAQTAPLAGFEALAGIDIADLAGVEPIDSGSFIAAPAPTGFDARLGLLVAWGFGSLVILAISGARVSRFHRTLARAARTAPPGVQTLATSVATKLGMRRAPQIVTTSARIAPLVWSFGPRARIVIPDSLCKADATRYEAAPHETLRCVLAHEIAHVRRHDPLVRWIEWAACVSFWWNPVVWWARRNLRANEELCCDALALESLASKPETYARSILAMVELVASRTMRPPAVASGIDGGGILERRFEMILSERRISLLSRRATAALLLSSCMLLPLGLAYAAPFADPADPTAQDERRHDHGDRHDSAIHRAHEFLRNHERMNHLTDDHLHRVFQAMPRIMHEVLKEGDAFELDPQMREHLSNDVGLTHEQIELVVGVSRRVAPAVRDDERTKDIMAALSKTEAYLREADATRDLDDDQITGLMQIVRRLVHGMLTSDGSFPLDDAARTATAARLNITDEQLDLAIGIAKSIAHHALAEPENELHAHLKKLGVDETIVHGMLARLYETGVTRDQSEEVLGVIVRIVHAKLEHAKQADGDRATPGDLDARLRDHLESALGFSEEQIETVIGLADRLAAHAAEQHRKHHEAALEKHHAALHEVMKKIRAAVESGDLTPDEAKAKIEAIHEKLRHAGGSKAKHDPEAIRRKIEAAVESGDLTREEADAKLRALHEMHGKRRDI